MNYCVVFFSFFGVCFSFQKKAGRNSCQQHPHIPFVFLGCQRYHRFGDFLLQDISLPQNFRLRMAAAAGIDCGIEACVCLVGVFFADSIIGKYHHEKPPPFWGYFWNMFSNHL